MTSQTRFSTVLEQKGLLNSSNANEKTSLYCSVNITSRVFTYDTLASERNNSINSESRLSSLIAMEISRSNKDPYDASRKPVYLVESNIGQHSYRLLAYLVALACTECLRCLYRVRIYISLSLVGMSDFKRCRMAGQVSHSLVDHIE